MQGPPNDCSPGAPKGLSSPLHAYMDEALKGTQNTALATLLNAAWPSSRVCCRKVEIFQLEQHLTRHKIRERACSAGTGVLRCKSNLAAHEHALTG